jgi:hypothetical protein
MESLYMGKFSIVLMAVLVSLKNLNSLHGKSLYPGNNVYIVT